MSASDTFKSAEEFVKRLRALRKVRRKEKVKSKLPAAAKKKRLSKMERKAIFEKTGGRCHVCGGDIIVDDWEADHVFSHALGGQHNADNYLPAHQLCNNYRWFYGPEEFQWILKLGVWLRTKIEKKEKVAKDAAEAFCSYDRARSKRRAKPNP